MSEQIWLLTTRLVLELEMYESAKQSHWDLLLVKTSAVHNHMHLIMFKKWRSDAAPWYSLMRPPPSDDPHYYPTRHSVHPTLPYVAPDLQSKSVIAEKSWLNHSQCSHIHQFVCHSATIVWESVCRILNTDANIFMKLNRKLDFFYWRSTQIKKCFLSNTLQNWILHRKQFEPKRKNVLVSRCALMDITYLWKTV